MRILGLPTVITIVGVVSMACVVSLLQAPSTASAAMNTNSRLSNGNASTYCNNGFAKGMVWLSNETDYYSETVQVGETATSVSASVRGALNTCRTLLSYFYGSGNTGIYRDMSINAINVSSSSARLTIHGTSFYRGSVDSDSTFQWSEGGNRLPVTIDVSGIAVCDPSDLSGSVSQTIQLRIYRELQYQRGGERYAAGAGTETVPVTVTRSCPVYDYELQPSVDVVDGTGIDTPQARTITGNVTNEGPTVSKTNTPWRLTKVTYSPTSLIPQKTGGVRTTNSETTPCAFFTGESECDDSVIGIREQSYPVNSPQSHSGNFTIGSYEVGTRICFALSVRYYNETADGDGWRHSDLRCYIAGKKPKVNVLGGDLYVGRAIAGRNSTASGRIITSNTVNPSLGTFGSWGEYAIVSKGPVTRMASGSGYAGGNQVTTDLLTFANYGNTIAECGRLLGCYTPAGSLPDIANRFKTSSTTSSLASTVSLSQVNKGIYRAGGALELSQSNISEGKWIVINAPTTNVIISGDITYAAGPFSQSAQIPQVVIIANSITIAAGVRTVDAWLVAPGSVNAQGNVVGGVVRTCDAAPSTISASVCDAPLTVNGPVIANTLLMLRTGGADQGVLAGDPAEVFNFRSDAYLWALSQGETSGRVTTVSTKELPPRY